jgi:hypothetical protein
MNQHYHKLLITIGYLCSAIFYICFSSLRPSYSGCLILPYFFSLTILSHLLSLLRLAFVFSSVLLQFCPERIEWTGFPFTPLPFQALKGSLSLCDPALLSGSLSGAVSHWPKHFLIPWLWLAIPSGLVLLLALYKQSSS